MLRKSKHDEAVNQVVALMMANPPMRVCTMAERLGFKNKHVSGLLALCRTRKVPGFRKIHQRQQRKDIFFYTIGEDKALVVVETPQIVRAPADLYRGWFNPVTGVSGSKLGV